MIKGHIFINSDGSIARRRPKLAASMLYSVYGVWACERMWCDYRGRADLCAFLVAAGVGWWWNTRREIELSVSSIMKNRWVVCLSTTYMQGMRLVWDIGLAESEECNIIRFGAMSCPSNVLLEKRYDNDLMAPDLGTTQFYWNLNSVSPRFWIRFCRWHKCIQENLI